MELAGQVLEFVGWAPECAQQNSRNRPRTLPPTAIPGLHLGKFKGRKDTDECPKHFCRLEINTSVIKMDNIAATGLVMISGHRVIHRSFMIHGVMPLEEAEYMEEIPLLHSLRVMEGYTSKVKNEQSMYQDAVVAAGSPRAHQALKKW